MGTLFMRMSSKEHSLAEIKELILKEINSRNPIGLVRKMGDRRGLANVSQGDLVIITHSNGFNGNSGVIAIATATSECLGPNPSFNPPLSGDKYVLTGWFTPSSGMYAFSTESKE